MERMGRLIAVAALALLAGGQTLGKARAQAPGDAGRGLSLARQLCSECHAVDRTQQFSPNLAAPRFALIAAVPGMTGAALSVALQTPHRTMPNVMLDADQLSDIVAYILSLRRAN